MASQPPFHKGVHPLPDLTQLQPLLITLLGPTASGKTALSLEIAERLNLPVINVDSRQLYQGMDLGTAKPTAEQQARVPHHLLDLRRPDQPITLQEFQMEAEPCLERELSTRGVALLVGGSGLYLKALTQGLKPPAVPPQPQLRQQLTCLGQPICHPLLVAADPAAAAKIAPADAVRTQRALEVLYATGRPLSELATVAPPPWRVLELGLNPSNLRQRIQQRTEQLYADGLVAETSQLAERYGADLPLLQTIGYGEALQVIDGAMQEAEAIRITAQRTRQFAKRQRTWFRRQHQPQWLQAPSEVDQAMTLIEQHLR